MEKDETVLKPIGEPAQLIERTSLEDWFLFVIAVSRKKKEERPAPPISPPEDKGSLGYTG